MYKSNIVFWKLSRSIALAHVILIKYNPCTKYDFRCVITLACIQCLTISNIYTMSVIKLYWNKQTNQTYQLYFASDRILDEEVKTITFSLLCGSWSAVPRNSNSLFTMVCPQSRFRSTETLNGLYHTNYRLSNEMEEEVSPEGLLCFCLINYLFQWANTDLANVFFACTTNDNCHYLKYLSGLKKKAFFF